MQPDPYERFWKQIAEVCLQQPDKTFKVWPPDAVEGSGVPPEYVYEADAMLCRTSQREKVIPRLGASVVSQVDLGPELTLIRLAAGADVQAHVRAANAGDESDATPHHLISIAPVNLCPADEPVPVEVDAQPWPPLVADQSVGRGIEILVIDTGMIPDYLVGHPWLAGVQQSESRRPPDDILREYEGHGTFIAGVIGAVAPGASIRVSNALQYGGALLETELGNVLLEELGTGDWPQIISLSAGAPTMDGRPLLGLEPFLAELAKHPNTVLIAAAGNDAKRDDQDDLQDHLPYHFWPAACAPHNPGVISVGALARHHDGRACFSNHGTSITVYARGEEHINAFLTGEYEYHHGLDPSCHNYPEPGLLYCPCSCVNSLPWHAHALFQGMARWSGTSFAAPLVAGSIAAYMTEIGESHDARTTAHHLIGKRAQQVTDIDGEQLLAFL